MAIKNEKFGLAKLALSNRNLFLIFFTVFIVTGLIATINLEIEAYPDIADTEVQVITKYPGRAADEVEKLLTMRIERELNSIPGLIKRRSHTIPGLSVIRLTFAENYDDYFARAQVLERLKNVSLPEGSESPGLGPLSSPVSEIYRYVLESNTGLSPMSIRTLQDWVVIPSLLRTEGLADITTVGGEVKQYQVIINPDQLSKYELDLSDLQIAIENNNANTGGNVLYRGTQEIPVRAIGAVQDENDLRSVIVGTRDNVPIFIRDLAEVKIGHAPLNGVFGYYDSKSKTNNSNSVQGIVLMLRGQNPGDVLIKLKQQIKEIKKTLKLHGLELKVMMDRSELVNKTLKTVSKTLIEGIIIVLLVIVFFLGNIKAALITASVIPLSLLFSFIMMKVTGIPANLLSLGAIDFGIVVDGAVVAIEGIMRGFHNNKIKNKIDKISVSMSEVEKQICFSILIIICAYIPIFLFQRIEGKLFSPMAFTIAFALLGALIFSIFAVPVIASWFFGDTIHEWDNPVLHYIQNKYGIILEFMLTQPGKYISIISFITIIGLTSSYFLGIEFLPELDEGAINLRIVLPAGTSLQESSKISDMVRYKLSQYPEIRSILATAGRNDDGTDPYGANRLEFTMPLVDYSDWSGTYSTKKELIMAISNQLKPLFPGTKFSFSQPILDNVSEAVTGSVADLAIILKGENLNELRSYALNILDIIKKIPGSSDNGIEQEGSHTQLTISMDRVSAALRGVNFVDIQKIVEMAIGGKTVSSLISGSKSFNIVVRYPETRRANPKEIGALLIRTASGTNIPLSTVANIELVEGPSKIARLDGERIISVWTNINGRDQGSFVKEAQKKVKQKINLPNDISIIWGGQFENLTRASKRLMIAVPLTLLIISLILFLLFHSFKETLIVLANVPFSLIGGVLALHIRNMNFNISAGVGFISLFGVSVMGGVLFIYAYYSGLKNKPSNLKEYILNQSKLELRPVLMMMTVAMLGLLPAMLATGIGSDIQRPMATVIVGGLFSSTILSIFALPLIYYWVHKKEYSNF